MAELVRRARRLCRTPASDSLDDHGSVASLVSTFMLAHPFPNTSEDRDTPMTIALGHRFALFADVRHDPQQLADRRVRAEELTGAVASQSADPIEHPVLDAFDSFVRVQVISSSSESTAKSRPPDAPLIGRFADSRNLRLFVCTFAVRRRSLASMFAPLPCACSPQAVSTSVSDRKSGIASTRTPAGCHATHVGRFESVRGSPSRAVRAGGGRRRTRFYPSRPKVEIHRLRAGCQNLRSHESARRVVRSEESR